MATSARCRSTSTVTPSSGYIAMPTLASISNVMPSSRTVSARAARSRAATSAATVMVRTAGSSTANSSPPSRATTSPGRTLRASR